jgi:hypothetical protein
MCDSWIWGERCQLNLVSSEVVSSKDCTVWGVWGPWGPWGAPVGCTFGISARRARVRTRTRQCSTHKQRICHYMGSYFGPGEDEITFEYGDVVEDLGVSPPRMEVEDEYDYEYQFCFFTTALIEVIEKPTGEYVVALPMVEVPQVVAGRTVVAEVAPVVARQIKEQSYAMDGTAVTLPRAFSELKPGVHVFTGELVNMTGAKFRIIYPFEVLEPLSLSAVTVLQVVAGRMSREIVLRNNELHDIKAPISASVEGPIRARVAPAEIIVPAKSAGTVRLDVELLDGTHNLAEVGDSSVLLSVSGVAVTPFLLPVPLEELIPAFKLPFPKRGPFTFTTDDDDTSDLHIVFSGSGGRLQNPGATPPPSSASADGSEITILWDPPLPKGTKVDVTVECPFPIKVYKFVWTYLV